MILLAALAFLLPGALLLAAFTACAIAIGRCAAAEDARDDSADWLGVGGSEFIDHHRSAE